MKSKRSNTERRLGEVIHSQQPAKSEGSTETAPSDKGSACCSEDGYCEREAAVTPAFTCSPQALLCHDPVAQTHRSGDANLGDLTEPVWRSGWYPRDGTPYWGVREHPGSHTGIPSQWWCSALLLQHWFELKNFCLCPILTTDPPFTRVTA